MIAPRDKGCSQSVGAASEVVLDEDRGGVGARGGGEGESTSSSESVCTVTSDGGRTQIK